VESRLVPVDPTASVVCFHLVDFLSAYRRLGTKDRHQFGFILRALGWSVNWRRRVADVARSGRLTSIAGANDRTYEKRLSLPIRCLTSGPTKIVFPPVPHLRD